MPQSSTRLAAELPPCDYQPVAYEGPSRQQVLMDRRSYCNPAIFTLYSEPLMIVEGHLQYLFDETGRRYLDMLAGISTVSCGHCHPHVTQRVTSQLRRLPHASTIYLNPNFSDLAARLAARLPGELEVTYFTNSGSEANDLAVHLARLYTGSLDIIALRSGYHGGSFGAMGLTGVHTWKYPTLQGNYIHHTVCPDPYRSPFTGTAEEVAAKSVQEMEQVILSSTCGRIAGFLAEPIQGVGGVTHGARNYLREAYDLARRHGGLCIADEVQTGFGRTGRYWGFQHWDVQPDIVTMAKAFGNGIPLGAVTTRREIAEKLTERLHFNTFGGNPLSMAAGGAVLDVIDRENLVENARQQGKRLKSGLQVLQQKHPLIGDVRGKGLMLGVELVRDRVSREPAPGETLKLLDLTCRQRVLFGKGGLYGNVIRLKPPLCLTAEDVDYALAVLDHGLGELGSGS